MQTQMYAPPLTKINKYILIGYVGAFILSQILYMSAGTSLVGILGLTTVGLSKGLIFQLITFPFIDKSLMTVVFNGLILWFIGSELERLWGSRFYLKFLAISTYSCGVIFTLFSYFAGGLMGITPLFGLTGTNLALLVAYGIIYAERTMLFMFLFPMKAKYFCLLLAVIELFMALTSTAFNSAWGHVVSMAVAFVFLRYQSLKARGLGIKDIMENHKSHQARKKRGNFRLIKTEEQDKADPEKPKFWQ